MARRHRPRTPRVPKTPPSRISRDKILTNLRLAARKGDRNALELALGQMRTLALSPRYWEKYLALLRNPLARLVDLTTIKQGERIAQQKGWKVPRPAPPDSGGARRKSRASAPRRIAPVPVAVQQPSLFD